MTTKCHNIVKMNYYLVIKMPKFVALQDQSAFKFNLRQ